MPLFGRYYSLALGALLLVPAIGFAQPDTPPVNEAPPEAPRRIGMEIHRGGLAYEPLEVEPQERADFLSGRIVDEKGAPIAGATVDAFHWYTGSEATTDANGNFDLRNKNPDVAYLSPNEKIEVTFSAPGYTPRYIVVQPLGKLKQLVVLRKDTFIYGTVRNAAGQIVPNAKVRAVGGPYEGDGVVITDRPYLTTSDDKGQFKLMIPGDTYELFVRAGKEASRISNLQLAPREGLLKDVALKPALTLRAKVVDSITGQPISDFHLKKSDGDFEGVSDKNGIVEIDGLFPGESRWDIEAAGYMRWWSAQTINEYEHKMVEEGGWQRNFDYLEFDIAPNMAPVTIMAEKGVRVQGRVLDPDGNPVAGATVAPALTGTGNSLTGDTRFSVLTNEKGEYDAWLPAGNGRKWNLMAHDGDYDKWRKWANGASQPIDTEPGQVVKDFDLSLERPHVVTGQVVGEDGKPVAHTEVRAILADSRDNRYYVPSTETDAEGRFTLRFVGAGSHYVQVEPFWAEMNQAPPGSMKLIEVKDEPIDVGTLKHVKIRMMNEVP